MASFAEFERNLISERTQIALSYKKSGHRVYGAIPYGYTRHGDELRADESELEVIRRIQEWSTEGWPLRKIAAALNQKGIRSKRKRQWYASTVRHILKNGLYDG